QQGRAQWVSHRFRQVMGVEVGGTLPAEFLREAAAVEWKGEKFEPQILGSDSLKLLILWERSELSKLEDQLWEEQARLSKVYSELTVKNHALKTTLERLQERESELRTLNRSLEDKVREQLGLLERSERLRRYLSPEVVNAILSSDAPALTTRKRT